jgi:hypothetical protein
MKSAEAQALPAPPSLTGSLLAGFNTTANHIDLVIIPILLDLFLWFGPHYRLSRLVDALLTNTMSQIESLSTESAQFMQAGGDFWKSVVEGLNLFASARTFPIGVPSLMVTSQPVSTPFGIPAFIDAVSIGQVVLVWLVVSIAGLALGTLYFSIISQAAISGNISWRAAFQGWFQQTVQVLLLALLWSAILLAISIPASCIVSAMLLSGLPFGDIGLLVYGGLMLWILFPLFLTPFGIFFNHKNVREAVKDSVRITRQNFPKTVLFFLILFLIDEGFTILWQVPEDVSWIAFIGIIGHAFIATGLVAAGFVYYRDASRWSQRLNQQAVLSSHA